MAVVHEIPHNARLVTASAILPAIYTPAELAYVFVNGISRILRIQPNCVYYVARLGIGGDVGAQVFAESILVGNPPVLKMATLVTNINAFSQVYPIAGYSDNTELSGFVSSDKDQDWLTAQVSGNLKQTPDTVGILSISLILQFSVYEISKTDYNVFYKGGRQ